MSLVVSALTSCVAGVAKLATGATTGAAANKAAATTLAPINEDFFIFWYSSSNNLIIYNFDTISNITQKQAFFKKQYALNEVNR